MDKSELPSNSRGPGIYDDGFVILPEKIKTAKVFRLGGSVGQGVELGTDESILTNDKAEREKNNDRMWYAFAGAGLTAVATLTMVLGYRLLTNNLPQPEVPDSEKSGPETDNRKYDYQLPEKPSGDLRGGQGQIKM